MKKEEQKEVPEVKTKETKDDVLETSEKKSEESSEKVPEEKKEEGEEENSEEKKDDKKSKKKSSKRKEVKDQRTIARKRDKALLAALGVFIIVVAGIALMGIKMIKPPKDYIQGQADCESVRVSGKLPGRIVKFYVQKGDYVHKGDTLASISCKTVDASLFKAKSAQKAAKAAVKKVEKGTRPELIETANNVVEQAKAAEEIAGKTYQRMENLFQEGVITEQKRDEAKAAYEAAQAAVRTAQSQAELAKNGPQSEDLDATESLEDVAKGTVMEVESLLEDQVLTAPCDGEVTEIYPHEGELVSIGTPVMSISKIDDLWISFNVREEKLANMPMDTVVNISIPALKDKKAKAKVFYIHDMGSYAVWNATKAYGQFDSKTFEVKVRPEENIEGLRPGMSVILDDGKPKEKKKGWEALFE